ncbi:helix-turn-helix transcriptional regulator [Bacillus sp. JJ722]|uniref:helix-turn-helix transcriptional regulator n=1 Tax=Bacillus sp. JJ722 TaxID=3122973 RepID=UPI002FFFA52D
MSLRKTKRKKTKYPCQEYLNIKGQKRQRLIDERKRLGLNQKQLGLMFGVSASLISHLESGRIDPSLEVDLGLQQIFNLPTEILFPDI